MTRRIILPLILAGCLPAAARTNIVIKINEAGTQTIPPNTVALPAQISAIESAAAEVADSSAAILAQAAACETKVSLYSTNYIVTSTVYVQSIGAIAYDASNQTLRAYSLSVSETNVVIVGTMTHTPLVPPSLDWRQVLGTSGAWSNIEATVVSVAVPSNVTAAAAYSFTLPRPAGGTAHFRLVDNSTGASGSGLYWIVFGAITVDGHKGAYGIITNVVGNVTNYYRKIGGIIAEPEPLGGL